jgi:hypothetical protein
LSAVLLPLDQIADAADTIAFAEGGVEAMRIDSAANVGIGTSSPVGKLDIVTGTYRAYFDDPGGTSVRLNGVLANNSAYGPLTVNGSILAMQTGGTEKMRITAAGDVGIGTSSPYSKLDVYSAIVSPTTGEATGVGSIRITNGASGLADAGGLEFKNAGDSSGYGAKIQSLNSGGPQLVFANRSGTATWSERARIDSSGNLLVGRTSASSGTGTNFEVSGSTARIWMHAVGTRSFYLETSSANALQFLDSTAGAERMRLDSSGNLLVGTTSADARFVVSRADNGVSGRVAHSASTGLTSDIFQVTALNHASGTGYFLARFYTSGPSAQFAVRGDGTVYAQNTTIQSISDARVKENVRDSSDGLATITALRPVRFDFKEGHGNNRKNQLGFIAQEVETVFPDAVDIAGEKDESGDPYKSVGPGALIPVLVKAIQELKAEFDAYKATHP